MKEPIIQIPRVCESWVMGLVSIGILEVTEEGIRCVEKNVPASGREPGQGQGKKMCMHPL